MLGKHKGRLPPVVIHCFTGDATQAAAYLKEGCYIGLTGMFFYMILNDVESVVLDLVGYGVMY